MVKQRLSASISLLRLVDIEKNSIYLENKIMKIEFLNLFQHKFIFKDFERVTR
jgi:hypothetical protein